MLKILRNRFALLLCMVLALSLATVALAVPSDDYSVLNVRFAPNGKGVNDVEFTAYKVADVTITDGVYEYSLTSPFAGSGIEINAVLNGTRVNADESAYKQLRLEFGNYINDNAAAVKGSGEDYVRTATTAAVSIGPDGEPEDGIAQFTNLSGGLYLIATNNSVRIGGTRFIPTPLLLNVPYEDGGVVNNYLTVNVKSTTENPTPPNNPDNPNNPNNPDNPPDNPNNPTSPGNPGGPGGPDEDVEIDILPDDVPLAGMEPELDIPDVDVPLATLPQTGQLWWPVPVMVVAGAALVIFGLFSRRKAARHE